MQYKDVQNINKEKMQDKKNNKTGYEVLAEKGLLFSSKQVFATMFGALMPV